MGKRGWVRLQFTDHPHYIASAKSARPEEVWANPSRDKIRLYCTACLTHDVGEIVLQEEQASGNGVSRTPEAIKLSLFNVPPSAPHRWIESRAETMLSHLKHCTLQDAATRQEAAKQHAQMTRRGVNAIESTPRANRTYNSSTIVSPQPVPYYDRSAPVVGSLSGRTTVFSQYSSGPSRHSQGAPDPFRSDSMPPPPLRYLEEGFYDPQAGHHGRQYSPTDPTISSRTGSPAESFYSNPVAKRSRTSLGGSSRHASLSRQPSMPDVNLRVGVQWSDDDQNKFELSLGRLTASAGFPLNWVTNPEFLSFCDQFLPKGIKIPSRKVLTQRIIPGILAQVRADAHAKVRGRNITLQCDGWTGVNNHHFIAFMATTLSDLITVKVNDTTIERKTAPLLLVQMEDVMHYTEREWGAIPIAFTTDASGESRKARRLLGLKYPHMVVPDCYAHQVNLIVGDYFKTADTDFLGDAGRANEVITWLRSKTALLGLLRKEMESRNQTPLSVIRPVPTRWTAFYLAYTRLLKLQRPLDNVIEDDSRKAAQDRQVIQPAHERSAREKAEKMVAIIKDPSFWVSIVRITRHLAPLAIAANVTQSAHCRMDEVLLTFGKLILEYQKLDDPLEEPVRRALIASIERRWNKSDQDVFIAAIVLNPFYRIQPFKPDRSLFSLGAIYTLFCRLWKRFFRTAVEPDDLYTDLESYIYGTGAYEHIETCCSGLKKSAAGQNTSPDPLRAYAHMFVGNIYDPANQTPILKLALHVLSICPNSASCERLFSTFGLILTKLRSRLRRDTLVNLAELKMHIRDEYLRDLRGENKTKIRERAFGTVQPPQQTQTHQTPSATPAPEIAPPAADHSVDEPASDEDALMLDPALANNPADRISISSNSSTRALRQLTNNLSRLSREELDEDDGDIDNTAAPLPAEKINVTLQNLFNFSGAYWREADQRSAVASLDQEMAFYELLDLDAAGEPDLDPDIDDAVASLFNV